MSMDYSIAIKLHTECNEENVEAILENGTRKGFRYYDQIGEVRDTPDILDARQVAKKIIEAHDTKPEFGPCVYTMLDTTTYDNAYLWFYEVDDGFLEFQMGSFGSPKKKDIFIDFDYYIRMCLDLCKNFQILEVRTTMD